MVWGLLPFWGMDNAVNADKGEGTMRLTHHEVMEWGRAAQAMYARGQNDLGRVLSATAAIGEHVDIGLGEYDRAATIYRAWLVFDEPKGGK